MSLETPDKIRNLQRKLYCKAKAEPAFRFYVLYDKICREDVLGHAYALARANAGAPGVDGVTFAQIEASGVEAWLAGLREDLVAKTYRPDAVRRVMIPKPGGGERPLGIPTIRDRVIQTAAKIVLEPVFEADFEDSAYGYRPRRSAIDAVKVITHPPHRNVFMLSNQQLTPISSRCRVVSNCGRDTSRAASREAGLIASSGTLLA